MQDSNQVMFTPADELLNIITTAYKDYPSQETSERRLEQWRTRLIPSYTKAVEYALEDAIAAPDEYDIEDLNNLFGHYTALMATAANVVKSLKHTPDLLPQVDRSAYTLRTELAYYISYLTNELAALIEDIGETEGFVGFEVTLLVDLQSALFYRELPEEILINLHGLFSIVIKQWEELVNLRDDHSVKQLPMHQEVRKEIVFINNYLESLLDLCDYDFFPVIPMTITPLAF